MRALLARLVATFRRRRLDREIEREIALHLDLAAADLEAGGMSREAARRAALRTFGGVTQTKEADREIRGFRMMDKVWADVLYAVRGFRRTPASTCALVVTLAVGIGVTTAVFSVVYGVLLKPLPFEEPGRLVAVNHKLPGFGVPHNGPQSEATYFTYRDHGRAFEDVAVWRAMDVSVNARGTAERIRGLRVSDGLLPLLRVRPFLGRLIDRKDDAPGAPDRVILTYGYWASEFGGARNVLGRSLNIDGVAHEVVGVLPASFIFLNTDAQVVLPLKLDRAQAHPGAGFAPHGIARLNPGVTLAQASDDISRMIPLIAEQFPMQPGVTRAMWESVGLAPDLRPLADEVIGDTRGFLWILFGTAGLVSLIASANVANLLLVRGEGRQREFTVRSALGASRRRIAGALVSESMILGLVGGALGVLVAQMLLGLLRQTAPPELPRASEIGIDGVVLVVTLMLSVLTVLTSALLPALKFGRLRVEALKDGGRATSAASGRHRTRSLLAVGQVALALVSLIVSGLMIRTFVFMRQIDPGFARPSEVQTLRIALPAGLAREPELVLRTYEQVVERLRQVPGVEAVGLTSHITMDRPQAGGGPFYVKDRPVADRPTLRRVHTVGPGYIEAMGKLVVAGRTVASADVVARRPIALLSANLAREWFGTPDKALGRQIGVGAYWLEVVGVVGDERDDGVNQPAPSIVYVSIGSTQSWGTTAGGAPTPPRSMAFVLRAARAGSPGFVTEVRHAVQSVNPDLPLANVRTLAEIQAVSMAQTSFATILLGLAAGVAVLLAVVGVYGVVSYIAAERTHEVGVRMALGARGSDVRRMLLRHGAVLAIAGVACGLTAAVLLTPLMSAMLYGVHALDAVTYVGVVGLLVAVTLLATYLPARRASLLQPTIALRSGA